MKKILALLTLIFAINAYAITVDDLVNRYSKQAVMDAIGGKIGHQFTITIDGSNRLAHAPSPDYITAATLAVDIDRAGMTVKTVGAVLLEKATKVERLKAENAEKKERDRQKRIEEDRQALEEMQAMTDRTIKAWNEELERLKKQKQQNLKQEQQNLHAEAVDQERDRQKKIAADAADIEANYFTFLGYSKPIPKALVSHVLWVVLWVVVFLCLLSFLIKNGAGLIRQVTVVKAWSFANASYLKKIALWFLIFGINLFIFEIAGALIATIIIAVMYWGVIELDKYTTGEEGKKAIERERRLKDIEFKRTTLFEDVDAMIQKNLRTLKAECLKTVYQDVYGNYFYDKWDDAIYYFIDNVLKTNCDLAQALQYEIDGWQEYKLAQKYMGMENSRISAETVNNLYDTYYETRHTTRDELHRRIFNTVTPYRYENNETQLKNIEDMTPILFEHFCADILRTNGWEARVTQATGDQGVDIVAQRADVKAVFQCKKYSNPVGNKAIQEIIAGKQFEQADIACVVSNAQFTASAKQIATVAGVYLLHYSELNQFAERLSNHLNDSDLFSKNRA